MLFAAPGLPGLAFTWFDAPPNRFVIEEARFATVVCVTSDRSDVFVSYVTT